MRFGTAFSRSYYAFEASNSKPFYNSNLRSSGIFQTFQSKQSCNSPQQVQLISIQPRHLSVGFRLATSQELATQPVRNLLVDVRHSERTAQRQQNYPQHISPTQDSHPSHTHFQSTTQDLMQHTAHESVCFYILAPLVCHTFEPPYHPCTSYQGQATHIHAHHAQLQNMPHKTLGFLLHIQGQQHKFQPHNRRELPYCRIPNLGEERYA